jgi:serine/threonine protein kinase
VIDTALRNKIGGTVIQKTIFIKSEVAKEALYQEVGIMIMLQLFPYFCRIIACTEKPASMILQYYSDGSLQDYTKDNKYGQELIVKFSKEISSALRIMHSFFLAHCDIKTQNGLIEVEDGVPTSYLTDFGITEVLSDKILASRDFYVINLRGLSVFYATSEAFKWFRAKSFFGVGFKKFDIYSFACIISELLTRKTPWN